MTQRSNARVARICADVQHREVQKSRREWSTQTRTITTQTQQHRHSTQRSYADMSHREPENNTNKMYADVWKKHTGENEQKHSNTRRCETDLWLFSTSLRNFEVTPNIKKVTQTSQSKPHRRARRDPKNSHREVTQTRHTEALHRHVTQRRHTELSRR